MSRDIQLYRVLQEDTQSTSARRRSSRSWQCCSCRWRYKETNHQFLASWIHKTESENRTAVRISKLVFHNRSSQSVSCNWRIRSLNCRVPLERMTMFLLSPPLTQICCSCIHYYDPSNIFTRAKLLENCSILETDNVREQILEYIFAPNGSSCLYIGAVYTAFHWLTPNLLRKSSILLLREDWDPLPPYLIVLV